VAGRDGRPPRRRHLVDGVRRRAPPVRTHRPTHLGRDSAPADGLHVRVRSSKTDQEGAGTLRALPYGRDPQTCPPCALIRWRALLLAYDAGGRLAAIGQMNRCGLASEHCCRGVGESGAAIAIGSATGPESSIADGGGGERWLFPTVHKTEQPSQKAMTGDAFAAMIQRRAAVAGYTSAQVGLLSRLTHIIWQFTPLENRLGKREVGEPFRLSSPRRIVVTVGSRLNANCVLSGGAEIDSRPGDGAAYWPRVREEFASQPGHSRVFSSKRPPRDGDDSHHLPQAAAGNHHQSAASWFQPGVCWLDEILCSRTCLIRDR